MRQLVLDTETTGLDPREGHRIIEIGVVELINRRLTGNHFHVYLNPDREVDEEAAKVHGFTWEMLKDKPRFADIAEQLVAFIQGSELLIHNAPFDTGFLDAEFERLNEQLGTDRYARTADYCSIFDTLAFARRQHPGQRNTLDALCKRYQVDNSGRDLHGALLDAEILADVYLNMTGGQTSLLLDAVETVPVTAEAQHLADQGQTAVRRKLTVIRASSDELAAHQQRLDKIASKTGSCYWLELENQQA